ncbi:MAG: serine/threonine protein kinase, partial [Pseudomonadales bacterium]|nr:serine/threonine protein kinase [Pseudomonadales bacterium]
DARIFALNSYENRVYQAGVVDAPPLIVKFYRPGRWTDEQILEEHRFTAELAALEIPVVAPLQIQSPRSLYHFEGFRFAVFTRISGYAPEFDDPDKLLVMGRFLGRVHGVGKVHPFRYRRSLAIDWMGEDSREYLLRQGFIPDSLRPAYESLSADLLLKVRQRFAAVTGIRYFRIHGDCHVGNVLWQGEGPNFVDFDDTLSGPAVQDLWMMLSGSRDQQQGQLRELIEGYNEFADFNPAELGLIEALRSLRIMHYSGWLARRWGDPAFPRSFPWFNTERYWAAHILELREQYAAMDEPPLQLML